MNELTIRVDGLGKRYRIGKAEAPPVDRMGRLRKFATSPFRYLATTLREPEPDEVFWALRDISFEAARGEVVGIVGRNGAGKTTLLKILSRITEPTEGSATIHGRVSSLLEVGTGFHGELTGRENVYLNGTILGMSKKEVDKKLDAIIDFSGVGKFLDTPVKRYSSGMTVRLAFSVGAHLNPDILFVDEVLSVGDAGFQKQSFRKLREMTRDGATVLVVSHNMQAILGLCTRVMLIDQGSLVDDGPATDVVRRYLDSFANENNESIRLADRTDRVGTGLLRFTDMRITDGEGNPVQTVLVGDDLHIEVEYITDEQLTDTVEIHLYFRDDFGRILIAAFSGFTEHPIDHIYRKGVFSCVIPRLPLIAGNYRIDVKARRMGTSPDSVENAATLQVAPGDFYGNGAPITPKTAGQVLVPQSWSLREIT